MRHITGGLTSRNGREQIRGLANNLFPKSLISYDSHKTTESMTFGFRIFLQNCLLTGGQLVTSVYVAIKLKRSFSNYACLPLK